MVLAHYHSETKAEQTLEEHACHVAQGARTKAKTIGQGDILFLLGLYHDLGKADPLFQAKFEGAKQHVDHSYAGARYLWQRALEALGSRNRNSRRFLSFCETIAYVIAAHHGMYDIPFDDGEKAGQFGYNKMIQRIRQVRDGYAFDKEVVAYAQQLEALLPKYGYQNLTDLLEKSWDNYLSIWEKLSPKDGSEEAFYAGSVIRVYLSLLKNSDIIDTINAYELKLETREEADHQALLEQYCQSVEDRYASFGQPTTELNRIRTAIAERVKVRGATDKTGVYRLNLPTGAGKTNLSLRYATQQMVQQGKRRFFYITPFLSVLEQNASSIKEILGQEGVLEHHSNVIREKNDETKEDEQAELFTDYVLESWDSPGVLTSMVQFFQTLFKTSSSSVRRFSSLIDSVVILDEVQSLPIEVTTLFNLTMNFLSQVMNTTIVLCTATQPTYGDAGIKHPLAYAEQPDIVQLTIEEQTLFSRTRLEKFDERNGKSSLIEVADFVLENQTSILVILNTKKSVAKLYELLQARTDRPLYQLSTNMCPRHRLDVIGAIKKQLQDDIPLICISTQLIEAGVDVDFTQVIRSYAGIDSIVQASGRCNREGKRLEGLVTLVNLTNEEENLSRLKEIKHKKDVTEKILYACPSPIDVTSLNDQFFQKYFETHSSLMDYPIKEGGSGYDYLSQNTYSGGATKGYLRQSFKTASQKIDLIKAESVGVLVPYDASIEKIAQLEDLLSITDYPNSQEWGQIKQLLKELQLYTVNLRVGNELLNATRSYLNGRVFILEESYYDGVIGLTQEVSPENFMF